LTTLAIVREAIVRRDISFKTTDGTTLRGWHYQPDGTGPHPTIVLSHGFSAVKEMYLDKYADAFVKAGLASVVYDNRGFGASDGEPRQEIDPWLQIRDYSDAITFAGSLEQTDKEKIGIWGSSYSGGHVLVVAADQRVAELPTPGACGLSSAADGWFARRPRWPGRWRGAWDAARCGAGSNGAVGTSDLRFLSVVYRNSRQPCPGMAQ
jgi:dienelactone hydrolase